MAEAAHGIPAQATLATRKQELARRLEGKLAQGYSIESQTDTQAVVVIKGRKRLFRSSVDNRQVVTIDELGDAKFEKIDNAAR